MKVGDYTCSRCGRKNTLERKGTELFQCTYCGAPYVIKGVAPQTQPKKTLTQSEKAKLEAVQKKFEKLKNKKISEPLSQRGSEENREKMRDLEALGVWAHIPTPKHRNADPDKIFSKFDLHGFRVVEKATGKTVFDFSKAKEDGKRMLWGIDERKYIM